MTTPQPRRPRSTVERSWPWIAVGVVAAVGIGMATWFWLRRIQSNGANSGSATFVLMSVLGILAVVLMAVTAFYTFRKRRRAFQEHVPGTMMAWLKAHVWLGWLALAVAFVHAAIRPFTPGWSSGNVTFVVLAVLVISGAAWRTVYVLIPPRVARGVGNLSLPDTEKRVAETQLELEKLTAGGSDAFKTAVNDLVARRYAVETLDRAAESFEPAERAAWPEAKRLIADRERYDEREGRQRRYAAFLQGWKLLHIPLAALLFALIVVHVLDVFGARRVVFHNAADEFPSSAACADCHRDITNQWAISVMSRSQLSPIDIAQTRLALKMTPKIGSFCVDCHAPVGVQIVKNDILPLGGANEPQAVNEGINCVACHALGSRPPGEGRGGFPEWPIGHSGATSLGTMVGPPLSNPPALPVPDHNALTPVYFQSKVAESQICAACHVVAVDLNHDGRIDESANTQDLVLQTTYDEWLQYVKDEGAAARSCVDCHMPTVVTPDVSHAPLGFANPTRSVASHTFVGVDYDLAPGAYTADQLREALAERQALLASAARLSVRVQPVSNGRLTAVVRIQNVGDGHDLPTGFAFVRQMWLQVTASAGGKPVCLVPAAPSGGPTISSPCGSGVIGSASQDLRTCDPHAVGLANENIRISDPAPLGNCDPWLTNYQKILTDGDPRHTGTFREVPYQSLLPQIVKLETRVADQQPMTPIHPRQSASFDYTFDVSNRALSGRTVTVSVVLRFRHLPPYFIRELGPFYPPGVTVDQLLRDLTVVDMARASARQKVS
jgi:Cytochrome c554 and c-prime